MKQRLLLPALFSMIAAAGMYGADVYFYQHSTDTPVNSVPGARKIVFNESSTDVFNLDGAKTTVNFAEFDYILLRKKDIPSGMDAASGVAGTEIRYDGNCIAVAAPENIEEISVSDVSGRLMARFAPSASAFIIPAEKLCQGVAIVKVVCGKHTSVSKVIIK